MGLTPHALGVLTVGQVPRSGDREDKYLVTFSKAEVHALCLLLAEAKAKSKPARRDAGRRKILFAEASRRSKKAWRFRQA